MKSEDAPLNCATCGTDIRRYLQPGATWHPCRDCDGKLCEKCCEAAKKAPK